MFRAIAAASVAMLGGCADDFGGGLVVVQNLAVTEPTCSFTAELTAPFVARGTIRSDSTVPYIFHPLVQSRITALEGQESLRTVQLNGARIELTIAGATVDGQPVDLDVADFPAGSAKFSSLFSAPVAPLGVSSAEFDLVPVSFLAAVAAAVGTDAPARVQVVARGTVYGDLGGDEISSDPFTYPVTICNDCVFQNLGECNADTEAANFGNPCNPYQDGLLDCCTSGGNLICPASPTEP